MGDDQEHADLLKINRWYAKRLQIQDEQMSKFADAISKQKGTIADLTARLNSANTEIKRLETQLPDAADHAAADEVLKTPATLIPERIPATNQI